MTNFRDIGDVCPKCGVVLFRNDSGVGQCRKCHSVFDPYAHSPEGWWTLKPSREDELEEPATHFGYGPSVRRFSERQKTGHILGTVNINNREVLYGSVRGARNFNLPAPGEIGSVTSVSLAGSIGISGLKLDRKHPEIGIVPQGTSYTKFRIYPHRQ